MATTNLDLIEFFENKFGKHPDEMTDRELGAENCRQQIKLHQRTLMDDRALTNLGRMLRRAIFDRPESLSKMGEAMGSLLRDSNELTADDYQRLQETVMQADGTLPKREGPKLHEILAQGPKRSGSDALREMGERDSEELRRRAIESAQQLVRHTQARPIYPDTLQEGKMELLPTGTYVHDVKNVRRKRGPAQEYLASADGMRWHLYRSWERDGLPLTEKE